MSIRKVLSVVAAALFGAFISHLVMAPMTTQAQPREPLPIGRYQVVVTQKNQGMPFLIDTATGEGWGLKGEIVGNDAATYVLVKEICDQSEGSVIRRHKNSAEMAFPGSDPMTESGTVCDGASRILTSLIRGAHHGHDTGSDHFGQTFPSLN